MAAAIVRRAPYKDFLQPALHRRFSTTSTLLLALVYIQAILLGQWNSFLWSWFPIGPVGIRTLFLFASALTVIILRISQYHVGKRASTSAISGALPNLITIQALEAWVAYTISSALFGLVFLWSASADSKLNWISTMSGDRGRLNERPVFLSFYLLVAATFQAIMHIICDTDRITIDVNKARKSPVTNGGASSTTPLTVLLTKLPGVVANAVMRAIGVYALAVTLYSTIFRGAAWSWAMTFFRPFNNLPKSNMLPVDWPWFKGSTLMQCLWAGVLLSCTWEIGNYAFSRFMVKAPLKNGNPLTNESKDPNGSLLNGLKSKKMPIRCFALWELAHIAREFELRRKAIFEDIDRKDGPMWSQVFVICLDIVKGLEQRVDNYGKPPPAPVAQPEPVVEQKPRILAPPKDDPIFQARPASRSMRGEIEKTLTQATQAPGHTPVSQLSPIAKKTFRNARDRVLTKEQQEALTSPQVVGQFQALATTVLRADYIGWWFRQDFRRLLTAAVLGSPHSELSHHLNAIEILSAMAVHSLTEDKFGNVHKDIGPIVRTFTAVIKRLEAFKASFPVHWTDVEGSKSTPEVDEVIKALKAGLSQVVQEFEPYIRDLRLTRTDIRLAKEAMEPTEGVLAEKDEKPAMREVPK
ncbi:Nucleoporin NDC1 like protein [Verticillium longisporum]|nr:Nucleoporin NDC1 like protein [Verticillium longisporum]